MSVYFNDKMSQARKDKDLSRDELGKAIGTSGAIIGRYERGDMKPSIEIAAKIANALDISLDYLVGSSTYVFKDKKMVQRLEDIAKLSDEGKTFVLKMIDMAIQNEKTQKAFA
jgi:transcriptional regulator with XRE-family HTH domain